jgi:hypothetical protein
MRPNRAGVVVATVVALLSLAHAATAGVRGLELSPGPGLATGNPTGSAESQCSPGKMALGGGFAISWLMVIDDLRPLAGLPGYRVQGVKGEGAPANWTMTPYRRCAYPLPGQELVSSTSPFDSSNKQVTATCPTGKRLVGTGAEIHAGNGEVVIDGIVPDAGLTSLTAQGAEDQTGYSGVWGVTAHAICANPVQGLELIQTTEPPDIYGYARLPCPYPKQVLGAGGDIVGATGEGRLLEMSGSQGGNAYAQFRVGPDADGISTPWSFTGYAICADVLTALGSTVPATSMNKDAPSPSCPYPGLMTQGGGEITGALGEVAIRNVDFHNGGDRVTVKAAENAPGTPASWGLSAQAICSPFFGLRSSNRAQSSENSTAVKSATASCAPDYRVLGVGGAVSEANGNVVLDALIPSPDLTSATAVGVERPGGYAGNWLVRVDVVCSEPPPGLERVSAFSGLDSSGKSVAATCPGQKNLLGLGADLSGANGEASINRYMADSTLHAANVRANEDADGYSGAWGLTAFAVCADP